MMNKNLIARYIWLYDTLFVHGRLTRSKINDLWQKSSLSDGNPLPQRTFYHYRRAIEEIFSINIDCNSCGEYYINNSEREYAGGVTALLLDSFAVGNLLADATDIADRIEIEEVPSAREFLPTVIEAIRTHSGIRFDYAGFRRSIVDRDIEFYPYFLKRYKQRWYMIGKRLKSDDIRTYALDRVKTIRLTGEQFVLPDGITLHDILGNIIGVTASKAKERIVRLRATRTQAKYFRALPLHRSQEEEITDSEYSVFRYRLKLNYELVHELMGLGDEVTVMEPTELRLMVVNEMRKALANYETLQ